ncbi:MAG: hypothetical protein E2O42_00970 [Nitrospina sp.]|nr:MAG: hypothetical protein E2O42_00970 [Nitrospina sp.]
MKKITLALIGALWVITLSNNAWAHSGLRVDLGGSGFGFSISDRPEGLSTFWFRNHEPYSNYYTRPYPARPYLGWGGYRGHHHPRHHQHWGHHSQHHPGKGHHNRYQRGHRYDGHGKHQGYLRGGQQGHHWRR